MIKSPAEILQRWIIAQGLGVAPVASGTSPDWSTYFSFMPDLPERAIAVYDTSGRKDGRIIRTGEVVEKQGFQVMVRGRNHGEAYARIWPIARRMDVIQREIVVIEDYSYLIQSVSREGTVLSLGKEPETTRLRFAFNGTISLTETHL